MIGTKYLRTALRSQALWRAFHLVDSVDGSLEHKRNVEQCEQGQKKRSGRQQQQN